MKTIAHNLLLFAALALPALCAAQPKPTDDPQRNLQKFDNFYRYLNMTYVDTVHNGQLVENAIREVLLQLDPHSAYVSPEEMVEVNESFDGSFSGIGIEFNVLNDTIIVVNVISGGPSEKVGLLPNDRIVEVNGQNVVGTKRIDVPKILRGPKGTKAETRVVRRGVEEPLDFTIVRDNIPINTVDAAYKVDPVDRLHTREPVREQHVQRIRRGHRQNGPDRCADPRPARQRRRPDGSGDPDEQLLPAARLGDRFDRRHEGPVRPDRRPERRAVQRQGDRTGQRNVGLGQRDRVGSPSGLGPGGC